MDAVFAFPRLACCPSPQMESLVMRKIVEVAAEGVGDGEGGEVPRGVILMRRNDLPFMPGDGDPSRS